MTENNERDSRKTALKPSLDRPSLYVPSVDPLSGAAAELAHRSTGIKGDRAAHRVYHGLYEDMLN